MNDNLPDIDFKEKKEKKGGFVGWLRGKLGFGSRGAVGQAGVNPAAMNAGRSAMNFGKAFGAGAGKFGASGGLAGLLAGKAGMIATVAMMAVAAGVYMANNAPAPGTSTAAFSSNRSADNYVPAILRSQAANQGSSLDMFKDTNKGSMSMEEAAAAPKDKAAEGEAAAAEEGQGGDPQAGAPEQENPAQDMMAKLQGGGMSSLTSQLGGGSSKFSGMGGFNNKFNQGQTGLKTGFTSGIGSGFAAMPKFDSRKNKMLAMKGSARPVFGGAKAGKKGKIGSGAFGQAKGMRDIQKSFSGTSIDGARSTQDKAWEGSTGDGAADGAGAGLSDGGAGIVTSPSIDDGGFTGGGGGGGTPTEPDVPDTPSPTDVSPWASLISQAMMYLMLSAMLSAIASQIPSTWPLIILKIILGIAALILGVMALMNGIKIMSSHGQMLLGTVYVIGGGVAIAAAAMSMMSKAPPVQPWILSAIAGVCGLIGSMLGGK